MGEVTPWTGHGAVARDPPKPLKRPCDHGLNSAWIDLEVQLGTIEAYNRLVAKAVEVRARIDAGQVKAQNPIYAVHPRGAPAT